MRRRRVGQVEPEFLHLMRPLHGGHSLVQIVGRCFPNPTQISVDANRAIPEIAPVRMTTFPAKRGRTGARLLREGDSEQPGRVPAATVATQDRTALRLGSVSLSWDIRFLSG